MQLQPYLFFEGRTEEALDFYRTALGAEVTALLRFRESPDPEHCPAGAAEKVMHASFTIGGSTAMASDGTMLRLEQAGFPPDARAAYKGARASWPMFLGQLEELLSRID